jgi:protease-4
MNVLFAFLGRVLKGVWNGLTFTRTLILNLLFLGLIIGLYYTIIFVRPPEQVESQIQPTPKPLLLNISGDIIEKQALINPYDYVSRSLLGQPMPMNNMLYDLVKLIRLSAKDPLINGMVLSLSNMSETSLTKLRYLAKAINEFKSTGKKVYAIGGHYSQSQYYLASYADEIYMADDGAVLLQGYGTYSLFFKDLLEKLKVSTHVFRVGTYKSFVEPYTLTGMSKEAKESNAVWLNQLWGAYVTDVAKNRDIDVSTLSPDAETFYEALKETKGSFAALNLKMGLVDALLNRPDMRQKLIDTFGSDGDDSFNYVSIYDYQAPITPSKSENEIAIVVVSGPIIDGVQTEGTAGGDTIARLLRDARIDKKIKSVVLRVDTPGGSAFASEVIRNEVVALRAAGKPVVVSMSSVAASGGYWISTSADKIIAQPTTITGSIGIFGILTTFQDTLAQYGVYNDGIGTTPFAGVGLTRALPPKIGDIIQLSVENGYERFINLVASQRNLELDAVERIAQGRVWTGYDAMQKGLVDQMGDYDDAINLAAKLANIDSYSLNWMEKPLSPTEQFILELLHQAALFFDLKSVLPEGLSTLTQKLMQEVNTFEQLNDPKGLYATCPNCTLSQ